MRIPRSLNFSIANHTNVQRDDPHVQLARGHASTTMRATKDARPRGNKETFAMIDSVAAVLGLASASIFLAHAIESYRAQAFVGAEVRFTSFKHGLFRRVQ